MEQAARGYRPGIARSLLILIANNAQVARWNKPGNTRNEAYNTYEQLNCTVRHHFSQTRAQQ